MAQETPAWLTQWASLQGETPVSARLEKTILPEPELIVSGTILLPYFEGEEVKYGVFALEVLPNEEEQLMIVEIMFVPMDGETASRLGRLENTFLREWHIYETTQLTDMNIHSGLGDTEVDSDDDDLTPYTWINKLDKDENPDPNEPPGLYLMFEDVEYGNDPGETLNNLIDSVVSYSAYLDSFTRWFVSERISELETHLATLAPTWIEDTMRKDPHRFADVSSIDEKDGEHVVTATLKYGPPHESMETPIRVKVKNSANTTNTLSVDFCTWKPENEDERNLFVRVAQMWSKFQFDAWHNYTDIFEASAARILTPEEQDVFDDYSVRISVLREKQLPRGLYMHIYKSEMVDDADFVPDVSFTHMMTMLPKLQPLVIDFLNQFIAQDLGELEAQRANNTAQKQPGWLGIWAESQQILPPLRHEWNEPDFGIHPYEEVAGTNQVIDEHGNPLPGYLFACLGTENPHNDQIDARILFPLRVSLTLHDHIEEFSRFLADLEKQQPALFHGISIEPDIEIDAELNFDETDNGTTIFSFGYPINPELWKTIEQHGWSKGAMLDALVPKLLEQFHGLQPHIEQFALDHTS